MTKKIFTTLFLLFFALGAYAQKATGDQKPDFSGTWVLDKKKSGAQGDMVIGMQFFIDITLVIEHNEPQLNIAEKTKTETGKEIVQNITIFTDGRRKPWHGKTDANNFIMYNWKGKTLVKTAKFTVGRGEGFDDLLDAKKKESFQLDNKEVWTLSKDGKTLTKKTSGGLLPGVPTPPPIIYVFRKQT